MRQRSIFMKKRKEKLGPPRIWRKGTAQGSLSGQAATSNEKLSEINMQITTASTGVVIWPACLRTQIRRAFASLFCADSRPAKLEAFCRSQRAPSKKALNHNNWRRYGRARFDYSFGVPPCLSAVIKREQLCSKPVLCDLVGLAATR